MLLDPSVQTMLVLSAGDPATPYKVQEASAVRWDGGKGKGRERRPPPSLGGARARAGPNKGPAAPSTDWSLRARAVGHPSCPSLPAGALPLQSPNRSLSRAQPCYHERLAGMPAPPGLGGERL